MLSAVLLEGPSASAFAKGSRAAEMRAGDAAAQPAASPPTLTTGPYGPLLVISLSISARCVLRIRMYSA